MDGWTNGRTDGRRTDGWMNEQGGSYIPQNFFRWGIIRLCPVEVSV
jgi:hypothetical protein